MTLLRHPRARFAACALSPPRRAAARNLGGTAA